MLKQLRTISCGFLSTSMLLGSLASTTLATHTARADDAKPAITVYKTPTCGCCQGWVDYLKDNGYTVETHDLDSLDDIKADLGLTDRRLHSCHTAKVGDYVVEGHVPVMDIERLLAEKPDIVGITAPGMPMMSPGMHSIEPKDYDVLSVDSNGKIEVFSRY